MSAHIYVPPPRMEAQWQWEGLIVGRLWPDGFDEDEYRLLLVGGRKQRLARPDAYTQDGAPSFYLSGYERRMRDRLLNAKCLNAFESHNLACNAGRTVVLNMIGVVGGNSGVNYFAVGTGVGVSPLAADTHLATEFFRKSLTSTTTSGNQIDLSTLFTTGEGNTTYTEAGIFGNGATGTSGTGSLFAHALYSYTKSSSINLTNDYYIYLT